MDGQKRAEGVNGTSKAGIRRLRRAALREIGHSFIRSWSYAAPGFDRALGHLLAAGESENDVIWRTDHGDVRKITLPAALGEETVVLKRYNGRRRWRHFCVPSPAAREAMNYRALAALGFPVVDLLAVGDNRAFLYLGDSYIVTRFLGDGFVDGRVFQRDTPEANDAALLDAFVDATLRQLAAMHGMHYLHRGAHPYNFLWRRSRTAADGVEIALIDVSSCRPKPARGFKRWVLNDLTRLFRSLRMPGESLRRHMDFYVSLNPKCGFSAKALAEIVPTLNAKTRPEEADHAFAS